jgi:MFS family permease
MLVGFVSVPFIGLFLFLQTTCVTIFFPVSLVVAAKVFSVETRGMAMGIVGTSSTIFAVGIIPYLLGLSGDLVSFRFGIIVLGAVAVVSSWLPLCLETPE